MKNRFFGLALLTACAAPTDAPTTSQNMPFEYPEAPTSATIDTLWGVAIPDPYRPLEDDRSEATGNWVDAQNAITFGHLAGIPIRSELKERFGEIYDYEKIGTPRKVGDYYFITKNSGLQNQAITYRRNGLHGSDEVFLDPNSLSEEGTVASGLGSASPDNRYITELRNEAGSDWQTIFILDVETGERLNDRLDWVKFSGTSWDAAGTGFYYSRYPAPDGSALSETNSFHSVYYHRLGTMQTEDKLIFRDEDHPQRYHFAFTTEDRTHLILSTSTGTDGNSLHALNLEDPHATWRPIVEGFETHSSVIDHVDRQFLVLTDIGATRYRLIAAPASNPSNQALWTEVLPESEDLLESVQSSAGYLFAVRMHNACHRVDQYTCAGVHVRTISLPESNGSVGGFAGKREDKSVFFSFTSFTRPTSVYEMNATTGECTLFARPEVQFEPEDFVTEQVWYPSLDGTLIPMFLVHHRDVKPTGDVPTYLYAYGGFNISLTPGFNPSNLLLLERGGLFAMPNLRGGGEFGEAWHEAGMLDQKQNVFDDFIAAARYLESSGWTSSERLAIAGGSNGGLLVGAVMTQQPDLARVAFPAVGVMDMLRYHKFTIGWGWVPEYGSADESESEFRNLLGYSPLHNLKDGTVYPSTLVTTADHDDRVVPAHSFKFAARLQAAHAGGNPVLIRIEKNAGHGAGKPTAKILEEQADKWAFMLDEMGLGGR